MDPAYENVSMWSAVCTFCDKEIVGEPYRDPEWVSWLGPAGAATYCNLACFEWDAER